MYQNNLENGLTHRNCQYSLGHYFLEYLKLKILVLVLNCYIYTKNLKYFLREYTQ